MVENLLKIENGQSIRIDQIPHLTFDEFYKSVATFVKGGGRIVQFFISEDDRGKTLWAVLRADALYVSRCNAPSQYPSLMLEHESFHMFERELAEQFGVKPLGHPWLKSVRYHQNFGNTPDVFGNDYQRDIPGNYSYYSVAGEQVHEVAVGPVHAGIIEPGHFRFNCVGERVLNLEIQLGYQHRGIERLLTSVPAKRRPIIMEGIAGDSAIVNSICFSEALESFSQTNVSDGVHRIRALALELERLANHIGDLGALSGDVAFLPPASYFGRIRGEFLNLLLQLSGNRFGKGLVRPGGIAFDVVTEKLELIKNKCSELKPQITHVLHLLFNAASVLSRFENTGTVSSKSAELLGLVGFPGRASGLNYDVRKAFPSGYYRTCAVEPQVETTGDVLARARVRMNEILQSLALIDAISVEPVARKNLSLDSPNLPPASFVVTLAEGWRGELSHCLITDATGHLVRYKIKDPSFHNWNGLAIALKDQEISDFPLCNKSFNLSYCGFDL